MAPTSAAFGVALADPSRRTILITGEGSLVALARRLAVALLHERNHAAPKIRQLRMRALTSE
jgi:TPP-dependent 2-oxoacid decarboxylase